MKYYFPAIILTIFAMQTNLLLGQKVADFSDSLTVFDPSIKYGKLKNGLTYYLKPMPDSQAKLSLRFYLKVGNDHQEPDQLDMAHFVEHMAFRSTKNFPGGIRYELKNQNRLGMGRHDVSGQTANQLTTFSFNAPAHNKQALETGLLWFKDIAIGLNLKEEEVDSERGVMVQEYLLRTPDDIEEAFAKQELLAQIVPCKTRSSQYIEFQESFDSDKLREFYEDWYRPDLMAIVIAGEIEDIDGLERQIINNFSDIPPKINPRDLPACESRFFNRSPQFKVVEIETETKPDIEKVEIELLFRDKKSMEMLPSFQGVLRMNKIKLFLNIVNKRIRENKTYGNYFDIYMHHSTYERPIPSSFIAVLSSYKNSEKDAVQTYARVIKQIQEFGITEVEFNEVKKQRIMQLENIDVNKPQYWLYEIQNQIAFNEAIPPDKQGSIREWLQNYMVEEFNSFIKGINLEEPDIGIIAHAGNPILFKNEEEIRSWIEEIKGEPVKPFLMPQAPRSLLPSSVIKKFDIHPYQDIGIDESGAHQFRLSNGIRVFLNPVKSFSSGTSSNNIRLHGFSTRGALDFPADHYFSAVNIPSVIKYSGVGKFNRFELDRYFSNTSLSLYRTKFYVDNLESGIETNVHQKDIEQLLQLVYLLFSQPRKDSIAFQDWKIKETIYNQSIYDVPDEDFRYNINKILGDNSGVSRGVERHLGVEATDLETGLEIHKKLFGNLNEFIFIITGDFQMDSIIGLVNKYLGNLKPHGTPISAQNRNGFKLRPSGPLFTQYQFSGSNTKPRFVFYPRYVIPAKDNWREKILVDVLGKLVDEKVWNLRTEEGYSLYTPGAKGRYNEVMNQYEFGASLECKPEEYPYIRQEFREIISDLKSELVSEEVLKRNVRKIQDFYEGAVTRPNYIHGKLYRYLRFDEPWVNENDFTSYLESITPKDIMNAAERYFMDKYLYEFLMVPKKD